MLRRDKRLPLAVSWETAPPVCAAPREAPALCLLSGGEKVWTLEVETEGPRGDGRWRMGLTSPGTVRAVTVQHTGDPRGAGWSPSAVSPGVPVGGMTAEATCGLWGTWDKELPGDLGQAFPGGEAPVGEVRQGLEMKCW